MGASVKRGSAPAALRSVGTGVRLFWTRTGSRAICVAKLKGGVCTLDLAVQACA